MTESPATQYARTSDGVSIAYSVFGQGPPLVILPLLMGSHVQMEWTNSGRRAAFERLAEGATVIHFDRRGMGLSDRDAVDFSTEAGIKDLTAVVDKLGLDRFAIFSQEMSSTLGFAFAAGNPARVTALAHRIIALPPTDMETLSRRFGLIRNLADDDWPLFTEIVARLSAGWRYEHGWQFAEIIRESHTPESYRAMRSAMVIDYNTIPIPEAPVLLLHAMGNPEEAAIARRLAGAIRSCQVVAIPRLAAGMPAESSGGPYPHEIGLAAILDFIAAPEAPVKEISGDSGLRTILFTDLVGHTEMMTRLGDQRGRDVLREHEEITREVLKDNSGTEVKTMGDGFMASFSSVTKAVECAVALQRKFAQRNQDPGSENLTVRVGLNTGEPIEEDGDLFGSTVILAARIAAQAEAEEILVSDVVRQLVTGKGFLFSDRGDYMLKGFEDPVKLYEVNWRS